MFMIITLLLLIAATIGLYKEFYSKPKQWMRHHSDGNYRTGQAPYQYFSKNERTARISNEREL